MSTFPIRYLLAATGMSLLLTSCDSGSDSGGAIGDPGPGGGSNNPITTLRNITAVDLTNGQVLTTGSGTGATIPVVTIAAASNAEYSTGDTLSARRAESTSTTELAQYVIGSHELTRGQWKAMVDLTGSTVSRTPWDDVDSSNAFGPAEDTTPAYGISLQMVTALLEAWNRNDYAVDLRLPTHAEWEYACRGGTDSDNRPLYYWADNESPATYAAVAEHRTGRLATPPTSRSANGYGLYDMQGNLWEWAGTASTASLRGGSWSDNLISAQFGNRLDMDDDVPYLTAGVRLVAYAPPSNDN